MRLGDFVGSCKPLHRQRRPAQREIGLCRAKQDTRLGIGVAGRAGLAQRLPPVGQCGLEAPVPVFNGRGGQFGGYRSEPFGRSAETQQARDKQCDGQGKFLRRSGHRSARKVAEAGAGELFHARHERCDADLAPRGMGEGASRRALPPRFPDYGGFLAAKTSVQSLIRHWLTRIG